MYAFFGDPFSKIVNLVLDSQRQPPYISGKSGLVRRDSLASGSQAFRGVWLDAVLLCNKTFLYSINTVSAEFPSHHRCYLIRDKHIHTICKTFTLNSACTEYKRVSSVWSRDGSCSKAKVPTVFVIMSLKDTNEFQQPSANNSTVSNSLKGCRVPRGKKNAPIHPV